jgi:hypothetical protein
MKRHSQDNQDKIVIQMKYRESERVRERERKPPQRAWMFVVSVVCGQAEVSATGRSLVQRSPTDCG